MKVDNTFNFLLELAHQSSEKMGGDEVCICLATKNEVFIVGNNGRPGLTDERKDIVCGMINAINNHFIEGNEGGYDEDVS